MSLRLFGSELGLSWKVITVLLLLANGCQGECVQDKLTKMKHAR